MSAVLSQVLGLHRSTGDDHFIPTALLVTLHNNAKYSFKTLCIHLWEAGYLLRGLKGSDSLECPIAVHITIAFACRCELTTVECVSIGETPENRVLFSQVLQLALGQHLISGSGGSSLCTAHFRITRWAIGDAAFVVSRTRLSRITGDSNIRRKKGRSSPLDASIGGLQDRNADLHPA